MSSSDELDLVTLAKRVEFLEARERDRVQLSDGINRLSDETAGLNSILTKVDEQQIELRRLNRDIKRVEDSVIPEEQIDAKTDEKVQTIRDERHKTIVRTAITAALVLTAILAMMAYAVNADNTACVQRMQRLDVQIGFYDTIATRLDDGNGFRESIIQARDELESTRVNCNELYPVYW